LGNIYAIDPDVCDSINHLELTHLIREDDYLSFDNHYLAINDFILTCEVINQRLQQTHYVGVVENGMTSDTEVTPSSGEIIYGNVPITEGKGNPTDDELGYFARVIIVAR